MKIINISNKSNDINEYTVEYIRDEQKYIATIHNDYHDEEEFDSVIFEPRSLKPRCQEMLMMLKNKSLLNDFYEGYTNKKYMPIFHNNSKINAIVGAFVEFNEESDYWYLPDESLNNLAATVYKQYVSTSSRRNATELSCRYDNLVYDKNKLMSRIEDIIDGIISV